MKAFRIIGTLAFIGIVIGLVWILVQPRSVHIQKSIFVNGTPEQIARETESFQSFNAWSPWNKTNPEAHYTIVTFEGFSGTFYSDFKLEPQGDSTRVTWIYDGENNTIKEKAMWILMKSDLNTQYEQGLSALKNLVESRRSHENAAADTIKVQ